MKISLRESEHKPRERTALFGDVRSSGGGRGEAMKKGGMGGAGALGKNEGTVRFLFGPNGAS